MHTTLEMFGNFYILAARSTSVESISQSSDFVVGLKNLFSSVAFVLPLESFQRAHKENK